MADLVRVNVESRDGVQVAAIVGEVDIASVGDVRGVLARALDGDAHGLVLDLTAAAYLDSAAVGMVFELAERLRRRGTAMRVVLPDGAPTRKTLLLTGVDRVAGVDSDVASAIAALEGD